MKANLSKQQIIFLVVVLVIIIALFSLLSALFTSHAYQKEDSEQFKTVIAAKDSTIAATIRERDLIISYYDTLIQLNVRNAETFLKKVNTPVQYKIINNQYEAIPININRLSKDSLRRAIANY